MPRFLFLLSFAIILMTLCLTSIVADRDSTAKPPVLVQIVQSHGARLPIVSHNQTAICGEKHVCGELMDDKMQSIHHTANLLGHFEYGKHLKEKLPLANSSLAFVSPKVHVRSTDEIATLQTYFKFFDELRVDEFSFPPVHSTDLGTDKLLNPKASPAVYLQYKYGMPEIRAACSSVLTKQNLTPKVLQELAKEAYSEGHCSDKKAVDCAVVLCDIGSSLMYTKFNQESFPKLMGSVKQLCEVSACVSNFTLGYDSNNTVHKLQGSKGQPLAQELLKNMYDFLNHTSEVKLHHYSVSSEAITSLGITLDLDSELALHPPPGAAFFFFLANSTEGPMVSVYFVFLEEREEGYRGVYFNVCHKARVTYPLKHLSHYHQNLSVLEKLIKASAPTSKEGLCYLDPLLKERMGCSVTPTDGAQNSSEKDCLFYRKQCTAFLSPEKFRLSLPNYAYYLSRVVLEKVEWTGLSSGAIAAIAVSTCTVGSLLGIIICYIRRRCNSQPEKNEYLLMDNI